MSSRITNLPRSGLPITEAADYIGVSESTIWRMIRDGSLSSTKIRGRRIISRITLDALLQSA